VRVAPGALIVVGGHSRHVGKTSVIEHLLRANAEDGWTAIKISAHRHAPPGVSVPLVEPWHKTSPDTQTGRYLAAGARRAFLVRAPDESLGRVATFIDAQRAEGRTVVVESNRIVQWLVPDVLFFVVDPRISDWKPSSALCLPIADAVVSGPPWDAHVFARTLRGRRARLPQSSHRSMTVWADSLQQSCSSWR
jgi:hypothetical protein